MLQYLPDVARAANGIGVIAGTQRPFVSFLIKNWPLTLFVGFATVVRIRDRYKRKELTSFNVLSDMSMILTPVVSLALLNQMAQECAAVTAATAPVDDGSGPPASPPPLPGT